MPRARVGIAGLRLGEAPCELATPRATPCERTCFSYNTQHTNTQTLPPIRARVTRKGIEPFLRRGASTMPLARVGIAGLYVDDATNTKTRRLEQRTQNTSIPGDLQLAVDLASAVLAEQPPPSDSWMFVS